MEDQRVSVGVIFVIFRYVSRYYILNTRENGIRLGE